MHIAEHLQSINNIIMEILAKITGKASPVLTKSNGKPYVLHQAELTSSKLAGRAVTVQRTMVNEDGEPKKGLEIGEDVRLWASQVVTKDGKTLTFFEAQTLVTSVSAEENNDIFEAISAEVNEHSA